MTHVHNELARNPRRVIPRLALIFALAVPAFVTGCATLDDSVSFELASQPRVYRDQWARKSAPLVYVQPAEHADGQLTAVFVPFRVTQPITDPEMIGYTQARVVWQTWLAKRIFSVMEFDAASGPFRRDRAVALARARGADLAIGGFVTYYNAGGPRRKAKSPCKWKFTTRPRASSSGPWPSPRSCPPGPSTIISFSSRKRARPRIPCSRWPRPSPRTWGTFSPAGYRRWRARVSKKKTPRLPPQRIRHFRTCSREGLCPSPAVKSNWPLQSSG